MRLSQHATARAQQRGMNLLEMELVYVAGTARRAPDGATRIYLTGRRVKALRKALDRIAKGAVLVEGKDGMVITAYKMH